MDENLTKLFNCINKLKNIDKNKINEISILAERFKDDEDKSRRISDAIMNKISEASSELKLSYLYVMDSILKNICEPFNKFFSESIVETFVSAFKSCKDTATREKLYKLRLTWREKQFAYEVTNELDLKVKTIDPNWPVIRRKVAETDTNNNVRKRKSEGSPVLNTEESKSKMIKIEEAIKEKDWTPSLAMLQNILASTKTLQTNNTVNSISESSVSTLQVPNNTPPVATGVYDDYSSSQGVASVIPNQMPNQQPPANLFNVSMLPFNTGLPPYQITNNYQPNHQNHNNRGPNRMYPHFWSHLINGFPQMPKIGIDPRLLFKCPYSDRPKPIYMENNDKYLVMLDRIQPCVFIDGNAYAIRYVCSYINVLIDGINFELATNEINFVVIRNQMLPMCIGGPYHEIIIDGWPYNVPMDGQSYPIKLGNQLVDIAFNVKKPFRYKILNTIPKFVSDWAEAGFFGHPKTLANPPLNPLENPALCDHLSDRFRMEIDNNQVRNPIVQYQPPNTAIASVNGQPCNPYMNGGAQIVNPPIVKPIVVTPPINIDPRSSPLSTETNFSDLDFTKYKYDTFKRFNSGAAQELHEGVECDICGLRFKDKKTPEFDMHLDYHYLTNGQSIATRTKGKSRGYTRGSKIWVLGRQAPADEPTVKIEESVKKKCYCPMFDDWRLNKCPNCNDDFHFEYVEEEDANMLVNAQMYNGRAYHPECIEDIKQEETVVEPQEQINQNFISDPLSLLKAMLNGNYQFPNV